jgi:putative oxidoreductase
MCSPLQWGAVELLQGGYAMSSVTAILPGKHTKPVSWFVWMYERFCGGGTSLQSPFLLAVRLYWGWQFMQTGWGKLHHLARVTEFFASLGIPFPAFTTHFIAGLEFVGGLLLIAGLASRLTGFLLAANMFVAYWTADRGALVSIFSDPGKFYGADPYTFLFASLLVLVFGAGFFSLDAAIAKRWRKRA